MKVVLDVIVNFFRNEISGFTYVVYVLVLLFIIFAIIGYFVTEKHTSSK